MKTDKEKEEEADYKANKVVDYVMAFVSIIGWLLTFIGIILYEIFF